MSKANKKNRNLNQNDDPRLFSSYTTNVRPETREKKKKEYNDYEPEKKIERNIHQREQKVLKMKKGTPRAVNLK